MNLDELAEDIQASIRLNFWNLTTKGGIHMPRGYNGFDYSKSPYYAEALQRGLITPCLLETPMSRRIKQEVKLWEMAIEEHTWPPASMAPGYDRKIALERCDDLLRPLVRDLKQQDLAATCRDIARSGASWSLRFATKRGGQPNAAWIRWRGKQGEAFFAADRSRWWHAKNKLEKEHQENRRLVAVHRQRHATMDEALKIVRNAQ